MSDEPGQVEKVTDSLVEPKPSGAPVGATDAGAETRIAENYEYWREHGGGWASEYDQRKKEQIYYHIQEIMLTEYIHHHAPAQPSSAAASRPPSTPSQVLPGETRGARRTRPKR